MVEESGILYVIIALTEGTEAALSESEYWLGPRLLEQGHPLLAKHLETELARVHTVVEGMSKSIIARNSDKFTYYNNLLTELEGRKNELYTK